MFVSTMAFSNIPSEARKKLRMYMLCAGLSIFVIGVLFAFVLGIEDLQLVGYAFMVLGPADVLMGLILFNPNDRL